MGKSDDSMLDLPPSDEVMLTAVLFFCMIVDM